MTVKELKEFLSNVDDKKEVIAKDRTHYEVEQILAIRLEEDKVIIVIND